jgi:hypothetical protein
MNMACSGLVHERDPLPDAGPWRSIEDRTERLYTGLAAIYGWYERHAQLLTCVVRDAEYHPLTREISQIRMGPPMAAYSEVLGATLNAKQRAMLRLALSFYTWRTLVRDGGLKTAAAARAMAQVIECAKGG